MPVHEGSVMLQLSKLYVDVFVQKRKRKNSFNPHRNERDKWCQPVCNKCTSRRCVWEK